MRYLVLFTDPSIPRDRLVASYSDRQSARAAALAMNHVLLREHRSGLYFAIHAAAGGYQTMAQRSQSGVGRGVPATMG